MVLALCVLLSAAAGEMPGLKFARVLWNGAPADKQIVDLGIVVLKNAGPGAGEAKLEEALELEARRLNADAFVFESSQIETVYAEERKVAPGEAATNWVAESVFSVIVASLFHGSPSNTAGGKVMPAMVWKSSSISNKSETKRGFFRAIRYVGSADERQRQQQAYSALTKAFLAGKIDVTAYDAERERLGRK